MLATLLLTGLLLAGPDTADPGAKISYKKKVMVDPSYKPTRTPEQIKRTLSTPPPRPKPRIVYRTVVRTERRRSYSYLMPRISLGLAYGFGYHRYHRHGWRYGIGLHWPWYGYR